MLLAEKVNSDFHILRLLCKYSLAGSHALLSTSMQMLTLVMVVVEQHTPRYEMQRDYAWLVSIYAVTLRYSSFVLTM